jgi:hypothetical protein
MATKAKDRVTPEMADHCGDVVKGMLRNYGGDPKKVKRTFDLPNIKELFYGFINEHGYDPTDQIECWQHNYKKLFCLELDFSDLVLPARQPGFDRLIVVAHGLTTQTAFDACVRQFPCYKNTLQSLDVAVLKNDRYPTEASYAIWVRDRVEANEELRNLSANDLAARSIAGQTLLERELHVLDHWVQTGEHLNVENITLCPGSRCAFGRVPGCDWWSSPSTFWIRTDWYDSNDRDGNLSACQVVS